MKKEVTNIITKITKILPYGLIIFPYITMAYITHLNWGLFRDEGMYVEASKIFLLSLPRVHIVLNISGIGIMIWAFLWKTVGYNLAVFRLPVMLFSLFSIYLFYIISKSFNCDKPWRYAFIIAFLPQFFIYSFQINGLVIGICFALLITKLYLDVIVKLDEKIGSTIWLSILLIFIFSLFACITNPFLLAYPLTIISLEIVRIFKKQRIQFFDSKIIIACLLVIILWLVFVFIFGEGLQAISRHGVNGQDINPRFFIFFFGHITMFLIYLGGMFPFLPFSFKKRIRLKIFVPISLVAVAFMIKYFPSTGAYDIRFHCLFLRIADWVTQQLCLPMRLVNVSAITLVFLGLYNLVNILYQAEKNIVFFFSIGTLSSYMFLMLINPYIASRLYIPGMLGLFFLVVKAYERKQAVLYLQIFYQIFLTVLYSYALYLKRGFFKI